jgi:hypothetical protein
MRLKGQISAACVTLLGLVGCGSTQEVESQRSDPGSEACIDRGCEREPGDPSALIVDGRRAVFAVHGWQIGDPPGGSDQTSVATGVDIDSIDSGGDVAQHCLTVPSAIAQDVRRDAARGIDNVWGRLLVPTKLPEATLDEWATGPSFGDKTVLIDVPELPDADDASGVALSVWPGRSSIAPKRLDGTDVWGRLVDEAEPALLDTENGWLAGGRVVSGTRLPSDVVVQIPISSVIGETLLLPLRGVQVGARVVRGSSPLRLVDGRITGWVLVDDWIRLLVEGAAREDPSICVDPRRWGGFEVAFRQFADLAADGTNGDRNVSCAAISVGIGFEAVEIELGADVPDTSPFGPCD